jgi:hypothetical protein
MKADNKKFSIVIDFIDKEKYSHKHSIQRRKVYQLEPEFDVVII